MSIQTKTVVAPCPSCGRRVDLGVQPRVGEQLACLRCGDYLEIINLRPPELDWVFSDFEPDEEEWGEEEWDEEEEWD